MYTQRALLHMESLLTCRRAGSLSCCLMWRLIHLQRLPSSVTYYSTSLNFLDQQVESVYSIQLTAGVCFLLGLFLLLSNLMSRFFGDSFLNVSIHMHVFHIAMGLPYSEKHRVSQNTFCQYLLVKWKHWHRQSCCCAEATSFWVHFSLSC